MKSSEKQRRIEAGRGKLVGEITAMRLRDEPGAEHLLRQAVNPRIKFNAFQALCRSVANKRKECADSSALAAYGTSAYAAQQMIQRRNRIYSMPSMTLPGHGAQTLTAYKAKFHQDLIANITRSS